MGGFDWLSASNFAPPTARAAMEGANLARPSGPDDKNTLVTETLRAAWADLTGTRPRDRTADDLSPAQKEAFAKAWSVDGDGIYRYSAYGDESFIANNDAFSLSYWMNKHPVHQVEKLFGRGTTAWTKDGDLEFRDVYDLDMGSRNFPGIPTNADPDETKIHSRISARALGLDPKKLWETANGRIAEEWGKIAPTLAKIQADVENGTYRGQADAVLKQAATLRARYNRINSGPYKQGTASPIPEWRDPRVGNPDGPEKRQDAKGGDSGRGSATAVSETAVAERGPVDTSGPRIVINPSVFHDEKDALCVAFNEAFRLVMEDLGFRPEAEPTEAQRKFFADTAYNDDELQLRRTIVARICTFDTSVSGETAPTGEQVEESVYFLDSLLDGGYCQNEWEESRVSEIRERLAGSVGEREPGEVGSPAEGDGVEDTGEQAASKGGKSTWVQNWDGSRTIRDRSKTTIVTKGDSEWKKQKEAEKKAEMDALISGLTGNDNVVASAGDASGSFKLTGEAVAQMLQARADEEERRKNHGKIGDGLSASDGHRLSDHITPISTNVKGGRIEDAGKGGLVVNGSSEDKARKETAPTQPAPTQPAPTQPAPTQPAPTQPAPTQPAPTQPTDTNGGEGVNGAAPDPNEPAANPNAADGGEGASEYYGNLEGADGQAQDESPASEGLQDTDSAGPTDDPNKEEDR